MRAEKASLPRKLHSQENFTPKKASLPVEPDGERTDHYVLADDSSDDSDDSDDYVADSSQWSNYDDESPFGYDDGSFRDAFEDDYDAYLSRQ